MMRRLLVVIALLMVVTVEVAGQGALSNQVLQLLTRVNSWTATNTFSDIRFPNPCPATPSITTNRIYTDASCNLYFNGALIAGVGGVTNPHNLLSTTHSDTLAASVVRGDVIIGNSTPAWSRLAVGAAGNFLRSNGTDVSWGTDGSALTNLPAANLTGTIAAISGVNVTNLNASNLASGTVPLARLSGITTSQISGAAAITYSQLTLTGGIVNADVNASAAIAYSKLNLATSILNTDIANTQITFGKWASNSCTNLQVPQYNGAAWVCKSLSHTDLSDGGTVTSVALALPAFITVSGSPVTTSGTLTGTLANQSANQLLAGPTSGAAAAPTFRALVVADLPTITSAQVNNTIALTGTDINTSNQVTATHLASALPFAQGGTNLTTAANNSTLVSNGSAWAAKVVPDCNGANSGLQFTQATNTFSCGAPAAAHNLLSATHSDTLTDSVVRGDLLIGNATPKWARLPKGTQGTLLTMNATDPVWSASFATATLTSSTPWSFNQTWNNAGVTFRGFDIIITDTASGALSTGFRVLGGAAGTTVNFSVDKSGNAAFAGSALSSSASGGVGYSTGAGCNVVQGVSRTTGVTCTGDSGAITLVSAAGSATPATFTVTDTSVVATDTIIINQKSGTDLYEIFITAVAGGSFKVTFFTTGGATTEQPVFNFAVVKAVAS